MQDRSAAHYSQESEQADKEIGGMDKRMTFTVREAARLLGISGASAYEAVRKGELPVVRIGRRLLVPRVGLDKLLADPDSPGPEAANR